MSTSDMTSFAECNFNNSCTSDDILQEIDVIDQSDIFFYYYMYKVATPALFGLVMLSGLVGNSMVVYVTLTRSRMHSVFNLLLLNLAFSDLTFLSVCIPFMAYHYAADNWIFGDAICKLSQYLLYVTVYVTVYTLVSISVVRFVHIVCSGRHSSFHFDRIGCIIAAIWATMLLANSPILFIYRVKSFNASTADGSMAYYYCAMDDHVKHGKQLFISFFLLTYIIPLIVIAATYLSILRFLKIRRQRSMARRFRLTSSCSDRQASTQTTCRNKTSTGSPHTSRVFAAIVSVFGLCWLPLHIHLLVAYFGTQPQSKLYQVFRVLCHVVAYSNACVHPFVYHYVSADFRESLRSLLRPCCSCCSSSPSLLRGGTDRSRLNGRDSVLQSERSASGIGAML